jgi:membrane-associated protein
MLSLTTILDLLSQYTYVLIFPLSIFEGPIITVVSGALAAGGIINIYAAFGVVVVGDMVGDSLYYYIGRRGYTWWHKRKGTKDLPPLSEQPRYSTHFNEHGAAYLYSGKFHGLGSAVLIAAGAARYPYGWFMFHNFVATCCKSAALLTLGYIFAHHILYADSLIKNIALVTSGVGLCVFVWVYGIKIKRAP